MTDQADVENALVDQVGAILYPNGLSGSPPLTVVGAAAKIFRGWPNGVDLDADLLTSVINVSIYPVPRMERNVTRYTPTWRAGAISPATYTLATSGRTITVGGVPAAYVQNLAVFVNGSPYTYQSTGSDSASTVAASLQALINAGVPGTTVSGAVITVPVGAKIGALRIGTSAPISQETKRQEKHFQISFWCPTPDLRDAVCGLVDAALGGTPWLADAAGNSIRLCYVSSTTMDNPEKEKLYRRDLIYQAEYASVQTSTAAQVIVFESIEIATDSAGDVLAGPFNAYA